MANDERRNLPSFGAPAVFASSLPHEPAYRPATAPNSFLHEAPQCEVPFQSQPVFDVPLELRTVDEVPQSLAEAQVCTSPCHWREAPREVPEQPSLAEYSQPLYPPLQRGKVSNGDWALQVPAERDGYLEETRVPATHFGGASQREGRAPLHPPLGWEGGAFEHAGFVGAGGPHAGGARRWPVQGGVRGLSDDQSPIARAIRNGAPGGASGDTGSDGRRPGAEDEEDSACVVA